MNEAIAEYVEVYRAALSRLEDEAIDDKPALARRMTEAYFRGRMDRDRIDNAVRRPTSRALARIEAAEAAIAAAQAELKAAKRAAFTHGRPIPVSTIKRTTTERRRVAESFR